VLALSEFPSKVELQEQNVLFNGDDGVREIFNSLLLPRPSIDGELLTGRVLLIGEFIRGVDAIKITRLVQRQINK
jgi:hypothetical protein